MGGAQWHSDDNSKSRFQETEQWKHQHYLGRKIIALHRQLHKHTTIPVTTSKKEKEKRKKERASGNGLDEQNPYV